MGIPRTAPEDAVRFPHRTCRTLAGAETMKPTHGDCIDFLAQQTWGTVLRIGVWRTGRLKNEVHFRTLLVKSITHTVTSRQSAQYDDIIYFTLLM